MNRRISLVLALAGVATAAAVVGTAEAVTPAKAPAAAAATTAAPAAARVRALLDGAQVKPRFTGAVAGAAGLFAATLDGSILRYTFTFTKLSGPAVAAQIHTGGPRGNGPTAQPL